MTMDIQEQISSFLKESGIDGAFIQKDENCRYISGFTGSDSFLFLTPGGLYLLTDSRYTQQAVKEAPDFEVVDYQGHLADTAARLAAEHGIRRLGVEEGMTWKQYLAFHDAVKDCEMVFCQPDTLRRVKTAQELELMQEACRISDEGFRKTVPFIKAGRTERELRSILECAMLEEGSDGKSFDTIVASGERSAFPHGTATDKVVEDGDLITFDFGAIYRGYHSDITRTVAVGSLTDRRRFIYDSVLACNEHIESIMKAGVKACDMDAEARRFLKEKELDIWFIHALGHSVGLEIHENPVLAPRDHTVLEENMTETVEPGVYIPGVGGVRIEDTTVILKDGIRILTKFPKALITV